MVPGMVQEPLDVHRAQLLAEQLPIFRLAWRCVCTTKQQCHSYVQVSHVIDHGDGTYHVEDHDEEDPCEYCPA